MNRPRRTALKMFSPAILNDDSTTRGAAEPSTYRFFHDAVYSRQMKIFGLSRARERMLAKQLVRRGITDERVLRVMGQTPRDRFLPPELARHAYDDKPLPIGAAQSISQPYMVALMCQAAGFSGHERVLEIGTGSGYQTAVMAHLTREIFSIEVIAALFEHARANLAREGVRAQVRCADGALGWPEAAPFDVIMVTAAMPTIPRPLLAQLSAEGRLIAPIGESALQTLVRIERHDGAWTETYFGECRFVPLSGPHGFK